MKKVLKEITPKMVESLFEILETRSPPKLVEMVESLVGILRNRKQASNYDVEVSNSSW